MRTILIGMLCLLIPFLLRAQSGIQFEKNLSWAQVKQKAKAEHKSIFVDCYATWCGPCKQMDAEVYPAPKVGTYMNERFISVKVQMDRTKEDDQAVKNWYGAASELQRTYHIDTFPTFLYFSSDGKPLHKHTGAGSSNDFLNWAKEAQDSTRQYYAVLRNYQPGKLDTAELKGLAVGLVYTDPKLAGQLFLEYLDRGGWNNMHDRQTAKLIGDFAGNRIVVGRIRDTVGQLALADLSQKFYRDLLISFRSDTVIRNQAVRLIMMIPDHQLNKPAYSELLSQFAAAEAVNHKVTTFLNSLSDPVLREKDNIILLTKYWQLIKPGNRYFVLFYKDARKIEHIASFSPGYADQYVYATLFNDIMLPAFASADSASKEPDWRALDTRLKLFVSPEIAKLDLATGQSSYYKTKIQKAIAAHSSDEFVWGKKRAEVCLIPWTSQLMSKISSKDFFTAVALNNDCWDVFLYADDSKLLQRSAQLAHHLIVSFPDQGDWFDTYANILYKLGRKKEALLWEQKAIALHPNFQPLLNNLDAMQKGKATWPSPEHPQHN